MSNVTVCQLTDKSPAAASDSLEIERSGASGRVVLTTVGAGLITAATPAAARSAITSTWDFVSLTQITAVGNIDFTNLAAGYDYLFSVRNAVPAVATSLRWRVSQSGTFDTGSSYGQIGNASLTTSTSALFGNGSTINATLTLGGISTEAIIQNPGSSSEYKHVTEQSIYANGTPVVASTSGCGVYGANQNACDGFRIFFNGQNFQAVGSIAVFRRSLA